MEEQKRVDNVMANWRDILYEAGISHLELLFSNAKGVKLSSHKVGLISLCTRRGARTASNLSGSNWMRKCLEDGNVFPEMKRRSGRAVAATPLLPHSA